MRKRQHLTLPCLVLVKECDTQVTFHLEMTSGRDKFFRGDPIERNPRRNAARARFNTTADDTPGSPSMSIWRARSELTVASSICSRRRWISPLARPARLSTFFRREFFEGTAVAIQRKVERQRWVTSSSFKPKSRKGTPPILPLRARKGSGHL